MHAPAEDEFVARGQGGHELHCGVFVGEVEGHVADAFFAVGEMRGRVGGGGVELVDVCRDVVDVVDVREADAEGGAVEGVVNAAVYVEELGVAPFGASVRDQQGFVGDRVGLGIGDVVDVVLRAVGARGGRGGPGEGWRRGELEDVGGEFGGVGGVAEEEGEADVRIAVVVDVVVDSVIGAICAPEFFLRAVGPFDSDLPGKPGSVDLDST